MFEPNDGRVTNAILSTKLDEMARTLSRIEDKVDKMDARVDEVEKEQARQEVRWEAHSDLHKRERGLLAGASLVQSIVAGLAGIFVKPT